VGRAWNRVFRFLAGKVRSQKTFLGELNPYRTPDTRIGDPLPSELTLTVVHLISSLTKSFSTDKHAHKPTENHPLPSSLSDGGSGVLMAQSYAETHDEKVKEELEKLS
jgi:hypothetical protein